MTITAFFAHASLIWPLLYVLVKVSDKIIAEQRKQTQLLDQCLEKLETERATTYR